MWCATERDEFSAKCVTGTTAYYYYYDVDSEVCLGWSGELPFRSADSDVTRVVLADEEGSPIVECRPVPEEIAHQAILRDDALGEPPSLAQIQDGVWHRCEWMGQLTPGERVVVRFWSVDNLVDLQTMVVDDRR